MNKVIIRIKREEKFKSQETAILQLDDGSYRVRNYGYTQTLEGMLIRILSRHANTTVTVNFEIEQFTLSLIYESTEGTTLCGFSFSLLHDDVDQIASFEGEAVHYRSALRDIKAMAERWFKWAAYSLVSREAHYCDTSMLQWNTVTDLATWQMWVWNSEQRGGLAHLQSLEDAWTREKHILIPKLEALFTEVKNGQLAQTA